MPQTEILDPPFIMHPTELFHLSLPSPNFADKIGRALRLTLTRAQFAVRVTGVQPQLEKPRPQLENISKNAAGVK